MSLDHHPGFDSVSRQPVYWGSYFDYCFVLFQAFYHRHLVNVLETVFCHTLLLMNPLLNCFQGGALWFQNLTEIPNGLYGPLFPFLIAGLHYTNTQVYTVVSLTVS